MQKKSNVHFSNPTEEHRPKWRRRAEKFIQHSSFSGALYVFGSKSTTKRVFWTIVILTAVGGFCTVTALNILLLLREPISTSIILTRETELDFPAVTICSLNLLNATLLGHNFSNQIASLFDGILDRSHDSHCKEVANRLATSSGHNFSWGLLTTYAANDFSKLLLKCTYEGNDCSADDFERINTAGGLCYTFNGPKRKQNRTAQETGIRKGLRLQLLSTPGPFEEGYSVFRDYGYRVIIHNPNEPPRPESEGLAVALNFTAYISMRQIKSVDKTVYSSATRCSNSNNTIQDLLIQGYTSYSRPLCQEQNFYKYVIQECGCVEWMLYTPHSHKYRQLRNCTAPDICCEAQAFDAVNDTSFDCFPKCDTVDYVLMLSTSTSQLKNQVGVNVFYESLILETRETTDSYTPWSLISDIGGNTGLFLGITLLSWVELMLLVYGLMKDCCCNYYKSSAYSPLQEKV